MATQIVTGGFDPLSVYPVGSIYLSVTSTNPSDLFGGRSDTIQPPAFVVNIWQRTA